MRITGRQDNPGALNQVPGMVLFGRPGSLRIERGQPRGGLELAVGANSLSNVYPKQNLVGQAPDPATGVPRNLAVNNYFLQYSGFSPFGFNGCFLCGRVAYRF